MIIYILIKLISIIITKQFIYELRDFINIYNMYKFVYSKNIYIIDDYK